MFATTWNFAIFSNHSSDLAANGTARQPGICQQFLQSKGSAVNSQQSFGKKKEPHLQKGRAVSPNGCVPHLAGHPSRFTAKAGGICGFPASLIRIGVPVFGCVLAPPSLCELSRTSQLWISIHFASARMPSISTLLTIIDIPCLKSFL